MDYVIIILFLGLFLCLIGSISNMQRNISYININLNKIAKKIGANDNLDNELKNIISKGEKVEAIKKCRINTGLGLKEAKEYIDSLDKL